MNIKQKITSSVMASAVVLGSFVPPAFATNIHISEKGHGSENHVSINSNISKFVRQINNADIMNNVRVVSSTGDNRSNDNHGDVRVRTGDSNTSVEIQNHANMNHLVIGSRHDDNGDNNNSGKKLQTFLSDTEEIPGPGDPDGFGKAKVRIDPDKGELCVNLWVRKIEPATAAHIHQAPKGSSGPVVVNLPTPDSEGKASGCVSVDSNKLKEIKDNPENFYVNVHNTPYPNGAVRGQL